MRQLSLDQFENESRRMIPINNDLPYPTKKFTRQKSPQGLHKKASIILIFYSALFIVLDIDCLVPTHLVTILLY